VKPSQRSVYVENGDFFGVIACILSKTGVRLMVAEDAGKVAKLAVLQRSTE
jgi:hypothetical protein